MSHETEKNAEKICHEMRQAWMAVLADADIEEIESRWRLIGFDGKYEFLRKPEAGMIMSRGRADGSGQVFNLGELTVTRCFVRIEGSITGCGYVAGMNARHAELAALCDALLQSGEWGSRIIRQIIRPLERLKRENAEKKATEAASTRVEFFTMTRGE